MCIHFKGFQADRGYFPLWLPHLALRAINCKVAGILAQYGGQAHIIDGLHMYKYKYFHRKFVLLLELLFVW